MPDIGENEADDGKRPSDLSSVATAAVASAEETLPTPRSIIFAEGHSFAFLVTAICSSFAHLPPKREAHFFLR